jgi:agmatinase
MINHGTFLYQASLEGIIANNSVHAGIRCKFMVYWISTLDCLLWANPTQGPGDLQIDKEVGFQLIHADEIDNIGVDGIVNVIKQRVGDSLLYLRWVGFVSACHQ